MAEVKETLDCERAALYLVDEETGETWTKVGNKSVEGLSNENIGLSEGGLTKEAEIYLEAERSFSGLTTVRFPANTGITGHVCKTGRTINEPDVSNGMTLMHRLTLSFVRSRITTRSSILHGTRSPRQRRSK